MVLLAVASSIALFSILSAQINTAEQNACYEGGPLEGQCSTDQEWRCGWFLARWNEAGGFYSDYELPEECSAIPYEIPIEAEPLTPQDNACFPGGSMEGKCTTDWEWSCGWYLARWQAMGGYASRNEDFMPANCTSLLPARPVKVGSDDGEVSAPAGPAPTSVPVPPMALCISSEKSEEADLSIKLPSFPGNATPYEKGSGCTGTPGFAITVVKINDQTAAVMMCSDTDEAFNSARNLADQGYPEGYFQCLVNGPGAG